MLCTLGLCTWLSVLLEPACDCSETFVEATTGTLGFIIFDILPDVAFVTCTFLLKPANKS